MGFRSSRYEAATAIVTVAVLLLTTVAAAYPIDTDTVWTDEPRSDWGVSGSAPVSEAFQFASPVFAVERVRGRIFIAGRFTAVTNGDEQVQRAYIAAFDARSGEWISSWTPDLDGAVFALAAAPDGSALFVGGEFTRVNGEWRPALVALDPRTGATVEGFATRLRPFGATAPRVHALEVAGRRLYVGGRFGEVRARGAVTDATSVARVRWRTGRPDPQWAPIVEGGAVWAIGVAPKRDRIYLGGLFDTVDGRARSTFAVVRGDGRLDRRAPGRFGARFFAVRGGGFDHVAAIEVVGSKIFVGGQNARLVVARARDLRVERVHRTGRFGSEDGRGGDFQTLTRAGRIVFAGCHCWGRIRSVHDGRRTVAEVDSLLAFDARSGRHLRSVRPSLRGSEGVWGIAVARDRCLWIGGQLTRSGGIAVENLVRSCPR